MAVKNCKRCGVIFNDDNSQICSACKKDDEKDFQRVKEYLEENPRATLMEVSRNLKLSTDKVKRFVRDGRVETVGENEGTSGIECEKCGVSINSGRYCSECQINLIKGIQNAKGSLGGKKDSSSKSSGTGGFYFKGKK